jgi:hypothetical protein
MSDMTDSASADAKAITGGLLSIAAAIRQLSNTIGSVEMDESPIVDAIVEMGANVDNAVCVLADAVSEAAGMPPMTERVEEATADAPSRAGFRGP